MIDCAMHMESAFVSNALAMESAFVSNVRPMESAFISNELLVESAFISSFSMGREMQSPDLGEAPASRPGAPTSAAVHPILHDPAEGASSGGSKPLYWSSDGTRVLQADSPNLVWTYKRWHQVL